MAISYLLIQVAFQVIFIKRKLKTTKCILRSSSVLGIKDRKLQLIRSCCKLHQRGVPIVPAYPVVICGPGKVTNGNVVAKMLYKRLTAAAQVNPDLKKLIWSRVKTEQQKAELQRPSQTQIPYHSLTSPQTSDVQLSPSSYQRPNQIQAQAEPINTNDQNHDVQPSQIMTREELRRPYQAQSLNTDLPFVQLEYAKRLKDADKRLMRIYDEAATLKGIGGVWVRSRFDPLEFQVPETY